MPYEWIPMVASAALNAAGSLFGSSMSRSKMRYAKGLQSELMKEQSDMNMSNAEYLFNLENNYNHPLAMMQRELSAGMNPYAVASENGAGRSVPADAATPEVSQSGVSIPAPENPFGGIGSVLQSAASAMEILSKKKGQDLQNQYTEDTMETLVEQAAANLRGTILENQFKKIQNDFEPLVKKYGLQTEYARGLELLSQKDLNYQKIYETFENALNLAESRAKTREERLSIQEQRPLILANLRKEGTLLDEKANTERTAQGLNNAKAFEAIQSGNYSKALATTADAMRDLQVSGMEAEQYQKWTDLAYSVRTLDYRVDMTEFQKREVYWKVDKLIKECEHFAQSPVGKGAQDLKKFLEDLKKSIKN